MEFAFIFLNKYIIIGYPYLPLWEKGAAQPGG
jgi:hypothetical protein